LWGAKKTKGRACRGKRRKKKKTRSEPCSGVREWDEGKKKAGKKIKAKKLKPPRQEEHRPHGGDGGYCEELTTRGWP